MGLFPDPKGAALRWRAGKSLLPGPSTPGWGLPSPSGGCQAVLYGCWAGRRAGQRVASLDPLPVPEGRGHSWSQCPCVSGLGSSLPPRMRTLSSPPGEEMGSQGQREMPLGFPIIWRFPTQPINFGNPENKDRQVRKSTLGKLFNLSCFSFLTCTLGVRGHTSSVVLRITRTVSGM